MLSSQTFTWSPCTQLGGGAFKHTFCLFKNKNACRLNANKRGCLKKHIVQREKRKWAMVCECWGKRLIVLAASHQNKNYQQLRKYLCSSLVLFVSCHFPSCEQKTFGFRWLKCFSCLVKWFTTNRCRSKTDCGWRRLQMFETKVQKVRCDVFLLYFSLWFKNVKKKVYF